MFIFTHIEKCAGTSFNNVLSLTYPRYIHISKNKYGGNEIRNDLTSKQYNRIIRYYPSGIGGHSVRPYLDFLPKSKRITFLRNPIDRYMSQYNHLKETGWVDTIDEFLKKSFYNNFITVKIAGKSDLGLATSLLANYSFVGDVGEYNKSLNYLQDILNKKFYGNVDHENKRSHAKSYLNFLDLTNAEKLKVEENNQVDIKLYEKFIVKNNVIGSYSKEVILKKPSNTRVKIIRKLNKFKKEKIINPIRLSLD